jgi:hypothetical protein
MNASADSDAEARARIAEAAADVRKAEIAADVRKAEIAAEAEVRKAEIALETRKLEIEERKRAEAKAERESWSFMTSGEFLRSFQVSKQFRTLTSS